MYLKTMHGFDQDPSDSNEHSVLADVVSATFYHTADGRAEARCYVREPIKTAEVRGFCENERVVDLTGPAYLVGDNGKTISRFTPRPPRLERGFEMRQGGVLVGAGKVAQ